MNYQEINDSIRRLNEIGMLLEEEYINNGGEITEATEEMQQNIDSLRTLLTSDGVDTLGRWLRTQETRTKTLQAEKEYITRQISASKNTIDYIKSIITNIMMSTGVDKVKGTCYSFAATTATHASIDNDLLREKYSERISALLKQADIPAYVGVTISASATKVKEIGVMPGDEGILVETSKPSVRFTKPRSAKED